MDLIDRIETTRFLGGEFLLWLWFSRDVTGGEIHIKGRGTLIVSLETQIGLADPVAEHERVAIRGVDPFGSAEAAEALATGKLPRKVGLRVEHEQTEWAVTIDSKTLALSGVKLPAIASQGGEEIFYERMQRLEQIHELVHALYGHFLAVRLSPAWQAEVAPALKRWITEGDLLDEKAFERLHGKVERKSKGARSSGPAPKAAARRASPGR